MLELFVVAGAVGAFGIAILAVHGLLCAFGRVFPRLGAWMEE
jgi:hypothetical protein